MTSPLRVVLIHRYFAPDTPPYGHMLRAIADALANAGHDVHVLTCQPSYRRDVVRRAARRQRDGRVVVQRFAVLDDRTSHARKFINLVWFCLRLTLSRSAFRGANVVMAATTPPVAVARLASVLARLHGAQFVYHKQDIWPEVSGDLGPLHSMLRWLDHATELSAARVVVLSEDMAETVATRGNAPVATEVLNNFDPWELDHIPASRGTTPGLTLVFAGSLSRFQGLEHLVDVVRYTAQDERISWHFFGDGALRSTLEGLGDQVHIYGHRSPDEVAAFVRDQADLGVVSLNPGVIRSAYPSKTMTYLRNGCPLLAMVEHDSELARMVEEERIGITGAQADPHGIGDRLMQLAADPGSLEGARERARATYAQRFDSGRQLTRWVALLEGVAS